MTTCPTKSASLRPSLRHRCCHCRDCCECGRRTVTWSEYDACLELEKQLNSAVSILDLLLRRVL